MVLCYINHRSDGESGNRGICADSNNEILGHIDIENLGNILNWRIRKHSDMEDLGT